MALGIGKVGKGTSTLGSPLTVSWTGGGNSGAGSNLVAFFSGGDQSGTVPSAPSGWTLLASGSSSSSGTFGLYYILGASAISGVAFSWTGNNDVAAIDIAEVTGASTSAIDSSTAYSAGTTSLATLTSNAYTTVATNAIVLAYFGSTRNNTSPTALSTPKAGYTQLQANNSVGGSVLSTSNYGIYEIFSSVQTSQTTTCAASPNTARWCVVTIAFAQAAAGGGIILGGSALNGLGGTYFRNPIG